MGFFSGLCSFVSSCVSSVGSAICSVGRSISTGISSLASGIGKVVSNVASTAIKAGSTLLSGLSKVGGFLGKIATGAGKIFSAAAGFLSGPLGQILGPIIGELVIQAITAAITFMAKKMGIIDENEKPEEVGYRLQEAQEHPEWQNRDDFDSTKKYYDYLKTKIKDEDIDQNKLEEHKLEFSTMGAEMLRTSIEEELHIDFPIDFLIEIGRCRLDGAELMNIIKDFINKGYKLELIRQYLKGHLKGLEKQKVGDSLLLAMKNSHPEWSDTQVSDRINGMILASQQDNAVALMYNDKLEEIKQQPMDKQFVPIIDINKDIENE